MAAGEGESATGRTARHPPGCPRMRAQARGKGTTWTQSAPGVVPGTIGASDSCASRGDATAWVFWRSLLLGLSGGWGNTKAGQDGN